MMQNTIITHSESTEQISIPHLESWISFYARKNNLKITFDDKLPAPAAVPDTTNGAMPTILINPKLCMEKLKLTQNELYMVIFHEIEHLKEDAQMLASTSGKSIIRQRNQRRKEQKNMASSYHFLENILRDVFVNKEVVDGKNIPVLSDTLHDLYKHKLFEETDYTNERKHKQFGFAIVREVFVPEEQCIIDPQIRKIISRFQKAGILEKATTGALEERLQAIWTLIEPTYTKLLEEDKKQYEEEKKHKDESPSSENGEGDPESGEQSGEQNPFEEEYEQMPGHIIEDMLDPEDAEKLKKQIEQQIEQDQKSSKTREQQECEHKAKLLLEEQGKDSEDKKILEHTIQDIQEYEKTLQDIEKIKDSETGQSVIDEIVGIFEKIKSTKSKMRYFSKSPVDLERGTRLFAGAIATGIADFYGGNESPEMFEMDARKEKMHEGAGNFEITILADGTGSMKGQCNIQQKKAILLVFEALKALHDKIHLNADQISKLMNFKTEGYIFGSNSRKIKPLGEDFSMIDRLQVHKALDEDDGSDNNEGQQLEEIYTQYQNRSPDELNNIKTGKIKKLIFVFTDGGQDVEKYKKKLIHYIQKFREEGVMVYGVGIGTNADISRYETSNHKQGGAELCEDPSQLAQILKKLLSDTILSGTK